LPPSNAKARKGEIVKARKGESQKARIPEKWNDGKGEISKKRFLESEKSPLLGLLLFPGGQRGK
jgi:hypothetical protein